MLHQITGDADLVRALVSGENTPTNPRREAMLSYADLLTQSPSSVREEDLAGLRQAGLTDEEILSLVLITSLFNFWNRLAHGLGVEPDAWIAPALQKALDD